MVARDVCWVREPRRQYVEDGRYGYHGTERRMYRRLFKLCQGDNSVRMETPMSNDDEYTAHVLDAPTEQRQHVLVVLVSEVCCARDD